MATLTLPDDLIETARLRAKEAGYPSVEAYVEEMLREEVAPPPEEFRLTPEQLAEVERTRARVNAGGKTYTLEEVRERRAELRKAWERGEIR